MAALGRRIAGQLRAGDIVALDGPLGAGKTTLTRGLGAALGVRGTVTSPTFVIARTHPRADGLPPLVHVDAYRLGSAAELDDLDIDFAGSIVVVEWAAGMIDGISDSVLRVSIARPTGGAVGGGSAVAGAVASGTVPDAATAEVVDEVVEARVVTITAVGERWRQHPFA
nr:tRNA (adenosine(37)-N6)-threonylcarbamoyltransferase complex ATPase subunit type 1 TsaE [Marisediminicola senii]